MQNGDEIILPDGRVLPLRGGRRDAQAVVDRPSTPPAAHGRSATRDRRRGPRSDTQCGQIWNMMS